MSRLLPGEERKSFSKINPKLQLAWDSTSLGTLKRCPRRYQLSILEGWTYKRGNDIHLRFGILYHRALEVYDHHRFAGETHDESLMRSLEDMIEGCVDWNEDRTEFTIWDPLKGMSEEKADRQTKSIATLFRSVVWYLEKFKDDKTQTIRLKNGKPAVELSFRFDSGFVSGLTSEPYILSGHLDRVVDFQGAPYIMDRKTSGSTLGQYFFDQFSPNNQMSLYSLAGQVVLGSYVKGGMVDAAQIAKGFTAFERGFFTRTPKQLEEWLSDAEYWIKSNERFVADDYWPMNDTSCGDYGGCVFRGICSKDPQVRQTYLKSEFVQEYWDPLKSRGEI